MIKDFEIQTCRLSEEETAIATEICFILSQRLGKENIITSTRIINYINDRSKVKINGARFRKIINFIRRNNMVENLLATSGGYFVEHDLKKVQKYIEGLRKRGNAIIDVANSMEEQMRKYRKAV